MNSNIYVNPKSNIEVKWMGKRECVCNRSNRNGMENTEKKRKKTKEAYLMNKNCSKIENISTTIVFMRNMKIDVPTVR